MTALMTKSVLCPILVGRAPYLDVLQQQIANVGGGHGAAVLLAGEAGSVSRGWL